MTPLQRLFELLRITEQNNVPRRLRRGHHIGQRHLAGFIEVAKLLPKCEFIREWKQGQALADAKPRIKEFLTRHTSR